MRVVVSVAALVLVLFSRAEAQSVAAGVHFASSHWSEFDGADNGVGGRISWLPVPLIGIEADLTWYPSDFPSDTIVPVSGNRFEGIFGVTVGPRLSLVRPFVKAGYGFLQVGDTPEAFACIAIFPPPLSCTLAAGPTLSVWEIGGGVEVNTPANTFIRGDVSQRFLQYPGPAFRDGLRERVEEDFWGGALRFTLGAGFRF
jgi:hypothetical protein